MARAMPRLGTHFTAGVARSLNLAAAGETARSDSPPTSAAYRALSPTRLEALYEMAYLRVFIEWETFLEETLWRVMCGYQLPIPQNLTRPPFPTLAAAEAEILAGQPYVSWWAPRKVATRAGRYVHLGVHEAVLLSNAVRLEWFGSIRHRVAHGTDQSLVNFRSATLGLAGYRVINGSAGAFLRSWDTSSRPRQRWLNTLGNELCSLALSIAP